MGVAIPVTRSINPVAASDVVQQVGYAQGEGCHQVAKKDQAALPASNGTSLFTLMGFGLSGASSSFERQMKNIMTDMDEYELIRQDFSSIFFKTRDDCARDWMTVYWRLWNIRRLKKKVGRQGVQ